MLHRMFQNHKIPPHEFFTLDERHKTFMYASELLIIESENAEREEVEKQKRRKGGK